MGKISHRPIEPVLIGTAEMRAGAKFEIDGRKKARGGYGHSPAPIYE